MQAVPLTDIVQQQHGLDNQSAVMVINVEPGRASDRAGLLLGDVIVAINEATIESVPQIQARLGPQSVGQPLSIKLLRGGQLQTVTVTVDER
ncbi:MAG: PDZ domain-containing protein [Cyanobacteria bacterium J06628_6]